MLPGRNRIHQGDDFRRVFRTGRRAGTKHLVIHFLSTLDESHAPRVGFVVSRAVGNAVVRNRVKRRLRAILHTRLPELGIGDMIVVRALPAAADADSAQLSRAVDRAFERLAG
ncbi:ribonuclease P protein component [Nocardia zapadnayensis]|uniref:ribonuclease P protein component n=1 Tax=uncultured Brevibacterium sp. TaxID=189678 RepID=UPI0022450EC4|nr:ribonuclease P protein component [Nocardia zapadnayensis]MCX0278171.1 ribonuclease P protein component [Nocardia zapadnayensis]